MTLSEATRTDLVVLDDVKKTYGALTVIDALSLTIRAGEFVVLLGPSGSGKTTCLRLIAGMIQPDAGRIMVAGRDVSTAPMHKRNIGMVFQNYSLFTHMTVAQNVAYPLRVRGVSASETRRRVAEALDMIQLSTIAGRRPDQLSGGQQQRVALARALVFNPDVLLLDEPLSALDRVLREEMQLELRRIHKDTGKTMICVTHDRAEALTMADRIIVMRDGRIVQDDPPRTIYERSNSRFVAEFLGETNVVPLIVQRTGAGHTATDAAGRSLLLSVLDESMVGAVDCVIRVENLALSPAGQSSANTWRGVVTDALFLGDAVRLTVRCDPHTITARLPTMTATGLSIGSEVDFDLAGAKPMMFPRP